MGKIPKKYRFFFGSPPLHVEIHIWHFDHCLRVRCEPQAANQGLKVHCSLFECLRVNVVVLAAEGKIAANTEAEAPVKPHFL